MFFCGDKEKEISTNPITEPDKVIFVDVFNTQIGLFTNLERIKTWFTEQGMKDKAKDCEEIDVNGMAFRETSDSGAPYFFIYLPEDCAIETVFHESLHIAWFVLEYKGVDIDCDNHEVLAYLQAHIAREALIYLGLKEDE